MNQKNIRNFCIIAHIDHGKSTLADRILELTGAIDKRNMVNQILDKMDLERERGITIKLKPVRLDYKSRDGQEYVLNLIDTPGHVDFSYEVSRSLVACEGAILVVDATQGIEAQTLANLYLALDNNLEIIPVVNKIDLPNAEPEKVREEIVDLLGVDPDDVLFVSAKTGEGVPEILEMIVQRIPPPDVDDDATLRALIFDSHFDAYKGVIPYIRIVEGSVSEGMNVEIMGSKKTFEVTELGVFRPQMCRCERLGAGEVGYIAGQIKEVSEATVGDTVTSAENPAKEPLPGYRAARAMVFSGLYPVDTSAYGDLRDALEKLRLNDAALSFEPESSIALGFGFRCGFLGLLHMEIIRERLEREYGLDLITTAPSVIYKVTKTNGEVVSIDNPAELPSATEIDMIEEPYVRAGIIVPTDYMGVVMEISRERRGEVHGMDFLGTNRVHIKYDIPLSEILYDFFDKLKSRTRGYASLDYEYLEDRPSKLVKLDILVGGKPVDALSCIVHADSAVDRGKKLVHKLLHIIPRQMFEIPIQAAIGSKIIARETVRAMRKDVLAKCYGGDISRKRKLLEKQKEGKKRMKQFGQVEIPQEAFMAVLENDED